MTRHLTQNDFCTLLSQYSADTDTATVAKIYAQYLKSGMDVHDFIRAHLPAPNHVAVAYICNTRDHNALDRACRWLSQQKICRFDTISGPYVDAAGAKKLEDFLRDAIPVYPAYIAFCNDVGMPNSPASYCRMITFIKKGVIKTQWHPLQSDCKEFWMHSIDELTEALRRWAAAENMHNPVSSEEYISIGEAAVQLQLKPQKLLDWLYSHTNCYTYQQGQYLLSRKWVNQIADIWTHAIKVADLINVVILCLPAGKQKECKSAAIKWVQEQSHVWLMNPNLYPQHPGGLYVAKADEFDAFCALITYVRTIPVWSLSALKDCSGFSSAQLKKAAGNGLISGILQSNGNYLISTDELNRIQALADQFISLDALIAEIVDDSSLFNICLIAHRSNLLRFAAENNWWGLCVTSGADYPINSGLCKTLVLRDAAEELKERIRSWLMGYRQDNKTQFVLLLNHYQNQYPRTVSTMRKHYAKREINKAMVDMADLLLHLLPQKELADMSEKEIENIIQGFAVATLASCRELADFLYGAQYTSKQYEFDGTGFKFDTSAYSVADFAVMVAPIVNAEIIAELDLVRKAADNPKYAALWLYVALHVFAAWRNTDYSRLQAPATPYNPTITLQMVRNGTYTADDAKKVANYFIANHELRWMRPNKTKESSGIAPLYFLCPEDCKATFGLILSIATAHYNQSNQSKPFVSVVCDKSTISSFFGPHFLAACGGKNFSGRRANKALMQAVEYEGREEGKYNPLVAYSLASQMRSHKASYGKLAETTDIYLRDANFAGLSPDYVLYQMFQRGVCSFVVDVMLNQCYGAQYATLSVAAKTEAIRSVGIPVSQMDIALRSTQAAMDTAVATVQSLGMSQQDMNDALLTIAAGRAHGKEMDTQCIAKATGQGCKCPNRLDCLGCRYEITTKACLLKYLVAHQECQSEGASPIEIVRKQWIDQKIILPKIAELASHMQDAADADEMQLYIDLIQEVESNGIASSSAG